MDSRTWLKFAFRNSYGIEVRWENETTLKVYTIVSDKDLEVIKRIVEKKLGEEINVISFR